MADMAPPEAPPPGGPGTQSTPLPAAAGELPDAPRAGGPGDGLKTAAIGKADSAAAGKHGSGGGANGGAPRSGAATAGAAADAAAAAAAGPGAAAAGAAPAADDDLVTSADCGLARSACLERAQGHARARDSPARPPTAPEGLDIPPKVDADTLKVIERVASGRATPYLTPLPSISLVPRAHCTRRRMASLLQPARAMQPGRLSPSKSALSIRRPMMPSRGERQRGPGDWLGSAASSARALAQRAVAAGAARSTHNARLRPTPLLHRPNNKNSAPRARRGGAGRDLALLAMVWRRRR